MMVALYRVIFRRGLFRMNTSSRVDRKPEQTHRPVEGLVKALVPGLALGNEDLNGLHWFRGSKVWLPFLWNGSPGRVQGMSTLSRNDLIGSAVRGALQGVCGRHGRLDALLVDLFLDPHGE